MTAPSAHSWLRLSVTLSLIGLLMAPARAQTTWLEQPTTCDDPSWNLRYGAYLEHFEPTSRILYNQFSAILDGDEDRHSNLETKIDFVSSPLRIYNTFEHQKAGEALRANVDRLVLIADVADLDLDPYAETAYSLVTAIDDYRASRGKTPGPFVYLDLVFTSADLFNDSYSIVQNVVLQPEMNAHLIGMELMGAYYRSCGSRQAVNSALGVSVSTGGSDAEFLQRAGYERAKNLFGRFRVRAVFSRGKLETIVEQTLAGVLELAGATRRNASNVRVSSGSASLSKNDALAPSQPRNLTASPGPWSSSSHFWAAWRNPEDAQDAVAVWYSFEPPTSPTDGVRLPLPLNNPLSLLVPEEGVTELHVWLEDAAGNKDHNNEAFVPLRFDETAPELAVTSPSGLSFETGERELDLSGTMSDAMSGLRNAIWVSSPSGSIGDIPVDRSSWSVSGVPLVSGENLVGVIGIDEAGNVGVGTLSVTSTASSSDYALDVLTIGGGSVEKDPDQSEYADGTQVSLKAVPDDGYTFSGWSGDASGRANPLPLTMDADKSITARFTRGQGQSSVTVTILPAAAVDAGAQWRYRDNEWLDSGETYTFDTAGPGSSTDVEINFREIDGWTSPRSVRFLLPYGESRTPVSDPYIQDEAPTVTEGYLTGTNGGESDYFGAQVAVEGNTAVVSTRNHDRVYAFEKRTDGWIEAVRLEGSDVPRGRLGADDMAYSGGLLAVGDIDYDSGSMDAVGAIYLFQRSRGWEHTETLTPANPRRGMRLGHVLAMGGDVIAGQLPEETVRDVSYAGAVVVFERGSGDSWSETARLTQPAPAEGAKFGSTIATDGTVLAVGTEAYDGALYPNTGAVYVFRKGADGQWDLEQMLTGSAEAERFGHGDSWGNRVAVQGDLIAVGAPDASVGGAVGVGGVYLFRHNPSTGTWDEEGVLSAADANEEDGFGFSVALEDGVVIVGAPFRDDAGTSSGAAYVFRHIGGEWVEYGRADDPGSAVDGARLGASVAIDGDGIVAGAPRTFVNDPDQGAARVFALVYNAPPSASTITYPASGFALDLSDDESDTLPVTWSAASDGEGDDLSYVWKLAASESEFSAPMLAEPTSGTSYLLAHDRLDGVLVQLGVEADGSVTLFHRVDVTDGVNVTEGPTQSFTVARGVVTSNEPDVIPTEFAFRGAYPNPTSGSVRLAFDLPEPSTATLNVFDVLGRRVRSVSGRTLLPAGSSRQIEIDATGLSAGVYFVRAEFREGQNVAPVVARFTVVR